MTITFKQVPHPEFEDHQLWKAEGAGQNDLGQRTVKGVVLHRMIGSLRGTLTYFSFASTKALTDYGVGVLAQDGAKDDGVIIRFNNPLNRQSGWASGPLSAPYGDGLKFYQKYGINAINRDQASIEISGISYNTAFSQKAKQSVAALIAYWADQYEIPYDKFPISPKDGFSFIRYHQEFTIGTGKICPGPVVMSAIDELIEMARVIMKQYQEATAPSAPVVTYDKASIVKDGKKNWSGLNDITVNGHFFYGLPKPLTVTAAVEGVDAHVYADRQSPLTRKALHKGDTFTVIGWCRGEKVGNDDRWWITKAYSRIDVNGTIEKPADKL